MRIVAARIAEIKATDYRAKRVLRIDHLVDIVLCVHKIKR